MTMSRQNTPPAIGYQERQAQPIEQQQSSTGLDFATVRNYMQGLVQRTVQ